MDEKKEAVDERYKEPLEMTRMGRCAKLAWEHAVEEHENATISRPAIMTTHLLLGVLREPDCAGGLVLAKMGLDLELAILTTNFVLLHGRPLETVTEPVFVWADKPHTTTAMTVIEYSRDEAALYSDTYPIGTEHILLGLLRRPEGAGCRLLNYFGITETLARDTRNEFWEILKLAE